MRKMTGDLAPVRRLPPGPGFSLIPCATQIQPHSPAQTSLLVQECAGHGHTHPCPLAADQGAAPLQALGWEGLVKATDSGTKRPWIESQL